MFKYVVLIAIVVGIVSCSSQKIYVVRHAEKLAMSKDSASMMASNPPLSDAGKVRAIVLKEELKDDKIQHIFSTNTIRTTATAQPLAEAIGRQIQLYSPARDSSDAFIASVRSLKGNILIVGHSNTVDDIVNKLISPQAGLPGDLDANQYDNLYIITRKGKKWSFEQRKYGYPSNP